jgi:hypothetical protein
MKEREEAGLPEAADAMLQQWPAPERDEADWEASAEAIVRRLKDGEVDSVSDELLAPPLPAEPGEGRMPRRSEADGSLAELARARLRREPQREDAAAIAKESFSIMKEEDRIGARANTVAAAAGSAAAEREKEAEVVDLDEVRTERDHPQEREAPTKAATDARAGRLAAAALVAVGIAAGVAVYVQAVSHGGTSKPTAVVLGPAADRAPENPRQQRSEPKAEAEEKSIDVGDLPTGESGDEAPGGRARARVAKRAPAAAAKKVAVADEPAASGVEAPAPGESEDEDEDEGLRPALDEAVPLEPSTGAVSSALGSSLGTARRCVIGYDQASTATVVFSSDGRVKTVTVSGPAAGAPAEACIKNAFRAMRLPRFGKPTFTIRGITLRP